MLARVIGFLVVGWLALGSPALTRGASIELFGASGAPGNPGGTGESVAFDGSTGLPTLVDGVLIVGGAGGSGEAGGDGGAGGSADAVVLSTDPNAAALHVEARGGSGGGASLPFGITGLGGSANASATLTSAGDVDLDVLAHGGDGVEAGGTLASAAGVSTGGGSVRVSATQIGGRAEIHGPNSYTPSSSAVMVDAVRGASSGDVTLVQHAIGGDGQAFLANGRAYSSLTAENSLGGSLSLDVLARAGSGPVRVETEAAVFARATGAADAPLRIRAEAIGSDTSPGGIAGGAHIEGISAASDSGDIFEVGIARGGSGGTFGGAVSLENRLSAATTGAVTLVQEAYGGDGAIGGKAWSLLSAAQSAESLEVRTIAVGGQIVFDAFPPPHIDPSGQAYAKSSAQNQTGPAQAVATALGGSGMVLDAPFRPTDIRVGDAIAVADAESLAPGEVAEGAATARGGAGVGVQTSEQGATGLPGLAYAESSARSEGDARATSVSAGGATGSSPIEGHVPRLLAGYSIAEATASGGGDTTAQAIASDAALIVASATAVGLGAGPTTAISEASQESVDQHFLNSLALTFESRAEASGGGDTTARATTRGWVNVDARASATGSGAGRVEAVAEALDFANAGKFQVAVALASGHDTVIARASAAGAGGHSLLSETLSEGGAVPRVSAEMLFSDGASHRSSCETFIRGSLHDATIPASDESYVRAVADPDRGEALAWIAEQPLRGVELEPAARIVTLGEARLLQPGMALDGVSSSLTVSFAADELADQNLELAFSESTFESLQATGAFLVGFLDDVQTFELSISADGSVFGDFDGPVVRLPTEFSSSNLVDFRLDLYGPEPSSAEGVIARFAILATSQVPEPAIAVLCVVLCAALFARRRCECQHQQDAPTLKDK